MQIVLADLKGGDGFVSKDTVAGGYGSRLRPFSRVTSVIARMKRGFHDLPSVHLAYAAAIAVGAGHTVAYSSSDVIDADTAIVLSSLVDYRRETGSARAMRARGTRVGFISLAADKLPFKILTPYPGTPLYARFYVRPSFVANYLRIGAPRVRVRRVVAALDSRVERLHARREVGLMERPLSC
jgi:hypothetical protein